LRTLSQNPGDFRRKNILSTSIRNSCSSQYGHKTPELNKQIVKIAGLPMPATGAGWLGDVNWTLQRDFPNLPGWYRGKADACFKVGLGTAMAEAITLLYPAIAAVLSGTERQRLDSALKQMKQALSAAP
jgi:hypothetical protein